ncbi:MAG: aminotransferase class I/II-fold pyridoxal phosphate-dependent enzyme [Planctomycetota bacterium]
MDPTSMLDLATRCVHGGRRATPGDPDLAPPLRRATTFLQHPGTHAATDGGDFDGPLVYGRYASPNVVEVEAHVAGLEGAGACVAFGSGMAALHAALTCLVGHGRRVAVPRQVYGGTSALLARELAECGIVALTYDIEAPGTLERALAAGATLVLAEGLSNPIVRVADLPDLAQRAHAHGARLLVDSTFASPIVQRPLEHGADFVMHSATKALGGHSDLLAGLLLGSAEDMDRVRGFRKRTGAVLDPAAAWLLTRGLATLALRVRAQCAGACRVAAALAAHPGVARVHHPSLPSDPGHARAQRLLASGLYGSVVSIELAAGDAATRPFVAALHLLQDAPSLGGVESLASIPRVMSHAGWSEQELRAAGIGPGAVRLAIGIEDPGDLVADLLGALDALV